MPKEKGDISEEKKLTLFENQRLLGELVDVMNSND